MPGIFTISLDFELHWGVFDKKDRLSRMVCYNNTLGLIPRMLDLFTEYQVHVTWATVGSLFAEDLEEWNKWKPAAEPDYKEEKYSPYKWVEKNGIPPEYHNAHFSPELIKIIPQYPGQELATHTFGHYYCLEEQTNPYAFEEDLKAAVRAAESFNARLLSLVFPRNQFNTAYLKTCYDHGIMAVRTNPSNWYWRPVTNGKSTLIRKITRTADAYMSIGSQRTSYPLSSINFFPGEPLQLPASRFLRPWRSRYRFANALRLRRLKQELASAARHKECFHLWWHPENFGDHAEKNLKTLENLLKEYKYCQARYGMVSWNMGEYVANLCGNSSVQQQVSIHSAPALS